MEIITQSIDTKPLIYEHIINGIRKIKASGESDGLINLSLDLTRPERIEVEIYSKDDSYDLFIKLCHVEGDKAITTITDIPYNDEEELSKAVQTIIETAELKARKERAAFNLALEQLNRLMYRINDIKDIVAVRNDAMLAAHENELYKNIAIGKSLFDDLYEFISDRLDKKGES